MTNVRNTVLHIRRASCVTFEHDRHEHGRRIRAHGRPEFHVSALEIDATGAIVFAWGDLWRRLTPGLYDAVLTIGTRAVAHFRIECAEPDRSIERVSHIERDECADGFCCDDNLSGCATSSDCTTYVPAYDVPVRGDA
ncbi:hypothetical protein KEH57_09520 [Burkholderia cenocepacia]|uniref:hypothetical protein n=1 Tax=Burkholderia cenocepacia TaxID=95486 RepID=UPI001BABB0CE|nr:hypothetical protein [Burkholderia cenocepacia]QUO23829.1 hypothetical protein KEH57_09520 [Burkholderia cenocepacia]